jgi:RimJ/RimL family protein N-acetyltransferase
VHFHLADAGVRLRKPEPSDVDALFAMKNDPEIAAMLGGFSKGYTRADMSRWVESHAQARDEALYVMVDDGDRVLGHVGLYEIDHRIRTGEFAILLGDKPSWGKGIGLACTRWMVKYGFEELNLHRIHLTVLATNVRAQRMYEKLGFKLEGRLRHAQWKGGQYVDVLCMGILDDEWRTHAG